MNKHQERKREILNLLLQKKYIDEQFWAQCEKYEIVEKRIDQGTFELIF
jgi:hypothetical protein